MRTVICFLLLCLSLAGCDKDNSQSDLAETGQEPDLTVIGQDLEAQFWYRYDGETENESLVDLSAASAFNSGYLSASQVGTVLNFFTFAEGTFSVFRLDIESGATDWRRAIYNVSEERSVIWGAASDDGFFLGNYSPRNTTNYGYRAVALENNQATDHTIAFQVTQVYEPLYHNGTLYLCFLDSVGNYRVAVVNTDNRETLQLMDFGPDTPALFMGEGGSLIVIRGQPDGGNILQQYDAQTLQLAAEIPLGIDRFFPPGPMEARLVGDKLFYRFDFAQPSPVVFGPAVFNLRTGENFVMDTAGIVGRVQEELVRSIVLNDLLYFPAERRFALSYFIDRPEPVLEGGVLLISDSGELSKRIDLPFNPTFLARTNQVIQ